MKVRFWGTRGSLPAAYTAKMHQEKVSEILKRAHGHDLSSADAVDAFIEGELPFALSGTYGTCTSCVELETGIPNTFLLCDAGSGLWAFGNAVRKTLQMPATYHIFLSHLHWDHVQGFPMFAVACKPGDKIIIHGHHEAINTFFQGQMHGPNFPVSLKDLACEVVFDVRAPGESFDDVAGFQVSSAILPHPGDSYAYRFEKEGKAIVYATDGEHHEEKCDHPQCPYVDFFKEVDLLIFDTMAALSDKCCYWGHSTHRAALMFSVWARVKHLVMFHQDPSHSDATIDEILEKTLKLREVFCKQNAEFLKGHIYPEQVSMAYDSLELEL